MQNEVRTFFVSMLLCGAWPAAFAGPMEGDLFGYRLGARYAVTAETRGYFMPVLGQMVVTAQRPEMPPDFEKLELITTPKTFTIANIYATAEFADEEMAKALESRYVDLLSTLYGSKCSALKAHLDEALKLLCSKRFTLTVHRFKPDKAEKKHKVHVGLQVENDSPAGKRIVAQFEAELRQLEREGKKQRLEQAMKEQKLKGLQ
jgi:hypothetical protein